MPHLSPVIAPGTVDPMQTTGDSSTSASRPVARKGAASIPSPMPLFKPQNIQKLVVNTLALIGERDRAMVTPPPPQIGSGMPDGVSSLTSVMEGSEGKVGASYLHSNNTAIHPADIPSIVNGEITTIVETTQVIEVSWTKASHDKQNATTTESEATKSTSASGPHDSTTATAGERPLVNEKHLYSDRVAVAQSQANYLAQNYPARSREERAMFPRPAHELHETSRYETLHSEFKDHSGKIHADPREIREQLLTDNELDLKKLRTAMETYMPEDVHVAVLGLNPWIRSVDKDIVTSIKEVYEELKKLDANSPDVSTLVLPLPRNLANDFNIAYLADFTEYQPYNNLKQGLIPIILMTTSDTKDEFGISYTRFPSPDLRVGLISQQSLRQGVREHGNIYKSAAVGYQLARLMMHPAFKAELLDMMGKLRQFFTSEFPGAVWRAPWMKDESWSQKFDSDIKTLEAVIEQGLTNVLSQRYGMTVHHEGYKTPSNFMRIAVHLTTGDSRAADKSTGQMMVSDIGKRIPEYVDEVVDFLSSQLPFPVPARIFDALPPQLSNYKSNFYALTGELAAEGLHTIAEACRAGDPEAIQKVIVAMFMEHELFHNGFGHYAFAPEIQKDFIKFLYPDLPAREGTA